VTFFSDLFAELEPAGRYDLLDQADEVSFAEGDIIIRQDDPNRVIYVVQEGGVRVERAPGEGEDAPVVLAHLYLGAVFGEMSFLTHEKASATVVAEEPVQLLSLEHDKIKAMLDADDGFAARFYHSLAVTLADRLRETSNAH